MDISMAGLLCYFEDIVNSREELKHDANEQQIEVNDKMGK